MSVEPLGVFILFLGVMSLLRGPAFAMYSFVISTLLGSAAVITYDNLTIQPAHMMLGFIMLTLVTQRQYRHWMYQGVSFPLAGFWLLCTMLYGVIGAFLLPRVLGGITYVNAIGASAAGFSYYPVPLGPTSGNFTQSVYFIADVLCFLMCYSYARTVDGFLVITRAFILYCIGNIAFAFIDLATFWTGTGYLLQFIRNSTYVLHTETVVQGLKRIIGSFTEASSFANAALGALGFCGRLWLFGVQSRLMFVLSTVTLGLLVFSTATTGYAVLPFVLLYLYAAAAYEMTQGRATRQVSAFLFISPLLIAIVAVAIMLQPGIIQAISDLMDMLIFDKATSQSGIERASMNAFAMRNFFDTYGIGTGIGSVRASSFFVAVLASLGVFGAITYGLFLFKVLIKPRSQLNDIRATIGSAARAACFALLCGSIVSGTLIDLGLPFFILAGLACAVPQRSYARLPLTFTAPASTAQVNPA